MAAKRKKTTKKPAARKKPVKRKARATKARCKTAGNGGRDPVTGQFVPDNPGGPGRPQGSLDFMSICRRKAKENGVNLEDLVWEITLAMRDKATEGFDPTAAKMVVDRLCGMLKQEQHITTDAPPAIVVPGVAASTEDWLAENKDGDES